MKTETLDSLLGRSYPEPNTGCFIWGMSVDKDGYGQIKHGGKQWKAHRLALVLSGAQVPDDLIVDHACRCSSCVNPQHLRAMSQRMNTLIGVGPTAANGLKTHCKRGHAFDLKNTYRIKGHRYCRVCRLDADKRYLARRAEIVKP